MLQSARDQRPSSTCPSPSPGALGVDELVCHCLHVTASAILAAVAVDGCHTVRDVVGATEAGGGCTACHRRIGQLLAQESGASQAPSS